MSILEFINPPKTEFLEYKNMHGVYKFTLKVILEENPIFYSRTVLRQDNQKTKTNQEKKNCQSIPTRYLHCGSFVQV